MNRHSARLLPLRRYLPHTRGDEPVKALRGSISSMGGEKSCSRQLCLNRKSARIPVVRGFARFPGHGGGRFMYCLFRTFSRAPASLGRTVPTGTMLSEAGHPAYAERAADLLGDDDPAEVVDSSDNSGSFHTVSNPSCDLITLLSGSSDSTIIIRSCVQVIPAPPGAVFRGPAGRSP